MALRVKNLPANAADTGDSGSIPGSGRSPGGGCGDPLQCSCLESPMHRGAFRATAQSAAKDRSSTQRTHMCDITLYTHYRSCTHMCDITLYTHYRSFTHMCDITLYTHYRSFTHMCDITYYTRITAALPTCVTSHIIHALPQLYPHV